MTYDNKMTCRTFPTGLQAGSDQAAQGGEAVLPLARELGVSRKILHDWRKAWTCKWAFGIESQSGPQTWSSQVRPLATARPRRAAAASWRMREAKIAELERKIGQQAVDIDFFRKALRALDAANRKAHRAASRKSSKP